MDQSNRTDGPKCSICTHPNILDITKDVLTIPYSKIALKYGGFHRSTLHRHMNRCIGGGSSALKEELQLRSQQAMADRLEFVLSEMEDAYFAAKEVMMVDGEINFNPRDYEANIVYLDYNDKDEAGNPRRKTQSMAEVIEMLAGHGVSVQHTYIKQEDIRKTYRETMRQMLEVMDQLTKLLNLNEKDTPVMTELDAVRAMCKQAAKQMGTDYRTELNAFLDARGHRLRPDVRGMLIKESQEGSDPLPAAPAEVFALLPPSTSGSENGSKKRSKREGDNGVEITWKPEKK